MQSQSEQIWMYNRYEIVMEYAKRPRLPPPFVVISYMGTFRSDKPQPSSHRDRLRVHLSGMLISSISRQCVLKLKDYSDKKNTPPAFQRIRTTPGAPIRKRFPVNDSLINSPNSITPLVAPSALSDQGSPIGSNLSNSTSSELIQDRSLLGRLLNCKPCRQVTENQAHKNVGYRRFGDSVDQR